MFCSLWKRKDKCSRIIYPLNFILPRYWAETTKNLVEFVLNKCYCRSFPINILVQRIRIESMLSCPILKLKLHVLFSNPFSDKFTIFIYLFNLTSLTNRVFELRKMDFFGGLLNGIILRFIKKLKKSLTWFILFFLLLSIRIIKNSLEISCKGNKIMRVYYFFILGYSLTGVNNGSRFDIFALNFLDAIFKVWVKSITLNRHSLINVNFVLIL